MGHNLPQQSSVPRQRSYMQGMISTDDGVTMRVQRFFGGGESKRWLRTGDSEVNRTHYAALSSTERRDG